MGSLYTDPTTMLFGFFTLVLLEIILGIDNLIFISIVANKLPSSHRDLARIIGLSFALGMRITLLASLSWLSNLTSPLFNIREQPFSGRDLILLSGGAFLLFKSTLELHERLEGSPNRIITGPQRYTSFWSAIAQIVVLDAVLSIDSVITAIGMTNHLSIMIAAVIIAVLVMMYASNPLTIFVNSHPALIILCLAFLLMIGCSLIAEGFRFHIPKGYLYAAISFSVSIELFNQLAKFNQKKLLGPEKSLRARAAEGVERLLGGKANLNGDDLTAIANAGIGDATFNLKEREMTKRVLSLGERSIQSIMTPLKDLHIVDIREDTESLKTKLADSPFSRIVVINKSAASYMGYIHKNDILRILINHKEISIPYLIKQPLSFSVDKPILEVLSSFQQTSIQIAFIVDEQQVFKGIATLTDILEAIAGYMPQEHEVLGTININN